MYRVEAALGSIPWSGGFLVRQPHSAEEETIRPGSHAEFHMKTHSSKDKTSKRASDCTRSLVEKAIRGRRRLEFRYDGCPRVVEPYCLGLSTTGIVSLRAIQVRGLSASNRFGFGKLWFLPKIEDLKVLDETFIPDDPDYNPNDSAMIEIYRRI
jgi:hypothetical protein